MSVLFLLPAPHSLEKLKSLLIQQVVLSQLADCVLQSHQFLQMSAVSLLQHFHFLLQLQDNHLQLLLIQTVLVVAVVEESSVRKTLSKPEKRLNMLIQAIQKPFSNARFEKLKGKTVFTSALAGGLAIPCCLPLTVHLLPHLCPVCPL